MRDGIVTVGFSSVCAELPGVLGFTGFSGVVVFGPVLTVLVITEV